MHSWGRRRASSRDGRELTLAGAAGRCEVRRWAGIALFWTSFCTSEWWVHAACVRRALGCMMPCSALMNAPGTGPPGQGARVGQQSAPLGPLGPAVEAHGPGRHGAAASGTSGAVALLGHLRRPAATPWNSAVRRQPGCMRERPTGGLVPSQQQGASNWRTLQPRGAARLAAAAADQHRLEGRGQPRRLCSDCGAAPAPGPARRGFKLAVRAGGRPEVC